MFYNIPDIDYQLKVFFRFIGLKTVHLPCCALFIHNKMSNENSLSFKRIFEEDEETIKESNDQIVL